jgi:hypothetical protein
LSSSSSSSSSSIVLEFPPFDYIDDGVERSLFVVRCWLFAPLSTLNIGPSGSDLSTRLCIQRTPHAHPRLLHHVRIKLRRRHVPVPEQILDGPNVRPALQQMRRKRMPQLSGTLKAKG